MLVLVFFLLGVAIIVLQTTVFHLLPDWLGGPDLMFLLVVFLAHRADFIRGPLLLFLLGMVMDVASGMLLGVYPLIYLILFASLKGLARHVALNDTVFRIPLAVLAYLLVSGGLFVFLVLQTPDNPPVWSWSYIFLQMLLLALVASPVFLFFDLLFTEFSIRRFSSLLSQEKSGNRFKM